MAHAKDGVAPQKLTRSFSSTIGTLSPLDEPVAATEAPAPAYPTPYDLSRTGRTTLLLISLWSLIDTALAAKEFPRALDFLRALYEITNFNESLSRSTFLDAYNAYLLSWLREASSTELEAFLRAHADEFPNAQFNGRTVAILASAMPTEERALEKVRAWLSAKKPASEVLVHTDVLSIGLMRLICEKLGVPTSQVPAEFRDQVSGFKKVDSAQVGRILEQDKENDQWAEESAPPALQKLNLPELQAVDSFGMKVIRHSLLSLRLRTGKRFWEKYLEKLPNPTAYVDTESHLIDFFGIYKTLKTPEERAEFERNLDELNAERQPIIEARSIEGAERSWKQAAALARERGTVLRSDSFLVLLWDWFEKMLPAVQADVVLCEKILKNRSPLSNSNTKEFLANFAPHERDRVAQLAPVASLMRAVPPEKMVIITILEVLRLVLTGGVLSGMKLPRAVLAVGRGVEKEFESACAAAAAAAAKKRGAAKPAPLTGPDVRYEETWRSWDAAKVGALLVSQLIRIAKVKVTATDPRTNEKVTAAMPAIVHTYQYLGSMRIGVLKLHPQLLDQLGTLSMRYSVQPQLLPMLTPPKEWTHWLDGGYLLSRSAVVRLKRLPEQMAYIRSADKAGQLKKVYDGVNVLGRTAWTVNRRVLEVLTQVWNSGKDFLAIPKVTGPLELPPRPPRDANPSEVRDWQRLCHQLSNEHLKQWLSRCDANYKLEIARAFVGERMYFPHNMDFRGRTYPLLPHFNHLGNDLSRGLLIFWEGRKLGKRGLFWLKVHLANLFGHLKLTFDERVQFVDDNWLKIEDSVKDPYKENGFWVEAEDPWQALAVMFELTDAYKLDNPEEYVLHQPVHLDGTCNGLQHYAALGGDVEGAIQVNVKPSERPQDVYNEVAQITRRLIEKDAEKGHEDAQKILKVLNRKIIKQTVMTNVYGVTYVGAMSQIRKQLNVYYTPDETYPMSLYLTRHVFEAIRTLFSGAHRIQDWFSDCAKRIASLTNVLQAPEDQVTKALHMSLVIWTTPLGLPVVQPYRVTGKRQVMTSLQSMYLMDPYEVDQVLPSRQAAGFAPNYVHSLDASHMLMSATECGRRGLVFALVHDSYWTHAADMDVLGEVIRDSFVKLHSQNLIGQLASEFAQRYRGNVLLLSVPKTHPAVQKIAAFRKRWMKENGKRQMTHGDELLLERKRLLGEVLESSIGILSEDEIHDLYSCCNNFRWDTGGGGDKTKVERVRIWVPMVCPKEPKRGEFDVTEVKNSKYFFS